MCITKKIELKKVIKIRYKLNSIKYLLKLLNILKSIKNILFLLSITFIIIY